MFDLKGDVAVISGTSSGLGRQMARSFADRGANLVILARRVERLEELKKELEGKVKVLPIKCDVTNTEDIENAAKKAEEYFGKVTILVNCAGSSKDAGVLEMTDDEWDFTIATDQTSVFKMTRAFGNIMKKTFRCWKDILIGLFAFLAVEFVDLPAVYVVAACGILGMLMYRGDEQ